MIVSLSLSYNTTDDINSIWKFLLKTVFFNFLAHNFHVCWQLTVQICIYQFAIFLNEPRVFLGWARLRKTVSTITRPRVGKEQPTEIPMFFLSFAEQQFPGRTRKTFNFKLNNLPRTVLQLHSAQQDWASFFFWVLFQFFSSTDFISLFLAQSAKFLVSWSYNCEEEEGRRKSLKKSSNTLSLTHLYNRADFFVLIFFSFCMNRQLQSRARRENRATFAWFPNCFFFFFWFQSHFEKLTLDDRNLCEN